MKESVKKYIQLLDQIKTHAYDHHREALKLQIQLNMDDQNDPSGNDIAEAHDNLWDHLYQLSYMDAFGEDWWCENHDHIVVMYGLCENYRWERTRAKLTDMMKAQFEQRLAQ